MSSKNDEEIGHMHDLDLLIILYYLHVSYPMRSGCQEKSVLLRPTHLSANESRFDGDQQHDQQGPKQKPPNSLDSICPPSKTRPPLRKKVPKSNTTIVWTPIIEWYVVRSESKNKHQKDIC